MSSGESLENNISKAKELEKNYDWMSSVQLYRSSLSMIPEQDRLKAGGLHEWIGDSYSNAARQANSVEEFKKRMRMSVESYDKAAELFENMIRQGVYTVRLWPDILNLGLSKPLLRENSCWMNAGDY